MRRFLGPNGVKIKPSAAAKPYVAKPYSSTGEGQPWPFTNEFGQFQVNQLAKSFHDYKQENPDDTWDPKRGRPASLQNQHLFLEGSRKRKRDDETNSLLPQLPPVQVTIGCASLPNDVTPEEYFRMLMQKILQRCVWDAPGHHVTPQVFRATFPHVPNPNHRSPHTGGHICCFHSTPHRRHFRSSPKHSAK